MKNKTSTEKLIERIQRDTGSLQSELDPYRMIDGVIGFMVAALNGNEYDKDKELFVCCLEDFLENKFVVGFECHGLYVTVKSKSSDYHGRYRLELKDGKFDVENYIANNETNFMPDSYTVYNTRKDL